MLRDVRERLEMSRDELGAELDLSGKTIKRMESSGAPRYVRLALIGLLVTLGKRYGILWPDH